MKYSHDAIVIKNPIVRLATAKDDLRKSVGFLLFTQLVSFISKDFLMMLVQL